MSHRLSWIAHFSIKFNSSLKPLGHLKPHKYHTKWVSFSQRHFIVSTYTKSFCGQNEEEPNHKINKCPLASPCVGVREPQQIYTALHYSTVLRGKFNKNYTKLNGKYKCWITTSQTGYTWIWFPVYVTHKNCSFIYFIIQNTNKVEWSVYNKSFFPDEIKKVMKLFFLLFWFSFLHTNNSLL